LILLTHEADMHIKPTNSHLPVYTERRNNVAGSSVRIHGEENSSAGHSKRTEPLPNPEYLALSLDSSDDTVAILKPLWGDFKNGSTEARNGIVVYYQKRVVETAARNLAGRCAGKVDSEDLAQAAVVRVLHTVEKVDFDLEQGEEAEHYIQKAALWEMRDSLRRSDWITRAVRSKNKKINEVADQNPEKTAGRARKIPCVISASAYPSWEGEVAKHSLSSQESGSNAKQKAVRNAISQLPPTQREAIILYYYLSYSQADISREMGLSSSWVSHALAEAEETLRNTLSPLALSSGGLNTNEEQTDAEVNRCFSPAMIREGSSFSDGSMEDSLVTQTIAYFKRVSPRRTEVS